MSHPFDRRYFSGGGVFGGYAHEGYSDFDCHFVTARRVLDLKPESVLEIGAARGYVLRRLEDEGVRVRGLEISEHCRLTRAVEDVVTWDVTQAPWPVKTGEFDIALSCAFLEHVPEDALPIVFTELVRTTRRGLHGVDVHDDDHFDGTHCTIRDLSWWRERMPPGHEVVDKEDLESGPVVIPFGAPGVKLNVGSFTSMFRQGWRNLDVIDLSGWARARGYDFFRHDVREGLPYDDRVVDLVFACHFLEHLDRDEGARFLAECVRVMKPGGVLRVLVPDAAVLVDAYARGDLDRFDEMSPESARRGSQAEKLFELLCGGGHKMIYDWLALHEMLKGVGFRQVIRAVFRQSASDAMRSETTDLYPDLSLIVEAVR